MKLALCLAMLIYGGPAWAVTADESRRDCVKAVSGAIEAQKAWGGQSYAVADSMMSGITDRLFDLDCINRLALSGGIRFYGPGDLLSLLQRQACKKINAATDALNTSIKARAGAAHGLYGVESHAGITRRVSPQPSVPRRSVDINGSVDGAGAQTRGSESFNRTLREIFK